MINIGIFKIKVWIIKLLGKLIFKLGGYVVLEPYIFWMEAKIKINQIEEYKSITRRVMSGRDSYRWERLKQDLVDNGIKRKIHIQFTYCGNQKHLHLIDGNHRIAMLRELYGDDYEITVKVFLPDPFDIYQKYTVKNIYGGRTNPYDMFVEKIKQND